MTEIERKFRIYRNPPDEILATAKASLIIQYYLHIGRRFEVRLRHRSESSCVTIKSGSGKVRGEWEFRVPTFLFDLLSPFAKGMIIKTRYVLADGCEVDIFHGKLKGLILVEREFESVESADAYILPKWIELSIDVTENKNYKNASLATRGLQL